MPDEAISGPVCRTGSPDCDVEGVPSAAKVEDGDFSEKRIPIGFAELKTKPNAAAAPRGAMRLLSADAETRRLRSRCSLEFMESDDY